MSAQGEPQREVEFPTGEGPAIKGNVHTGGGDFVGRDKLILSGNIILLNDLSPEAVRQIGTMASLHTAVLPGKSARIQGGQSAAERDSLQRTIDRVLGLFDEAAKQGIQAQALIAGQVQISQVDLLMKKAILVRSEAEEMLCEPAEPYEADLDHEDPGLFEIDWPELFNEYQEAPRRSGLKEAYDLLARANEIDPTNTEVLLRMAELLIEITPDDPRDEERVLVRIQKLLANPQNEDQKFHLAQATLMLATTRDQINIDLLRKARALFSDLGRLEWVGQCDDLLVSASRAMRPGGSVGVPLQPREIPAGVFIPVGSWHFRVMGAISSFMFVEFYPDGSFQSIQPVAGLGLNVQNGGQWAFNPFNNLLEMQGVINGVEPFMLGVFIHGQQQDGCYGIGTDGYGYLLTRNRQEIETAI